MSIDNQDMFLYKDLPLPLQRKLTFTGVCSIVFGLLLIGFEFGGLVNGIFFSSGGGLISGMFSFYVGILLLVLCRQQIYVLKSLLVLIIIQFLIVLAMLVLNCLVVATSHRFQCEPNDFFFDEEMIKKCEKGRILAILAIAVNGLLLVSIIFSLALAIQGWRARKLSDHDSSNINSHLLMNIPLSLRGNFQKIGIAYIILGLSIVGSDVGLLLNEYPFSYYTGFISGFFSIVYAGVLLALSRKRIYVLTSLFAWALWQLIILLTALIMIRIVYSSISCSTEALLSQGKCKTASGIAIFLLIAVVLSIILTVMNMVLIVSGRRREQQYAELQFRASS